MEMQHEDVMSARKKDGTKFLGENGKPVRRKVADCTYPKYETYAEIVKAEGEANLLKYGNAQIATNAKNKARAEAVVGVSDTELNRQAMLRITQPENMQRIVAIQQQAAGDKKLYEALFTKLVEEVTAELRSEQAVDEPEEDGAAA